MNRIEVHSCGKDFEIDVIPFGSGFISVSFAASDDESDTCLPHLTAEQARALAALLNTSADWADENR